MTKNCFSSFFTRKFREDKKLLCRNQLRTSSIEDQAILRLYENKQNHIRIQTKYRQNVIDRKTNIDLTKEN